MATNLAANRKAMMGNKDKGGRHTKKAASKNLKQKRAEKRAKRDTGKQNRVV